MTELGQLEARATDFSQRNIRVVAVSVEGPEEARKTQKDFPHLLVASDHERKLSSAVDIIHQLSGPNGADTSAPTTILVDCQGKVKWLYRSERVIARLSPDELLAAADKYFQ
jgi:peroxiredoxin